MILAIIFFIIAVLAAYFSGQESWPFSWWEATKAFFGVLFIYLVILVFWRGFKIENNKSYEFKSVQIESLVNKTGFSESGAFVLGCGTLSGRSYDYYVTYARFPEGLLRLKLNASSVYVRETNLEEPKIINYYQRTVYKGFKSLWVWDSKPSQGEWVENLFKADKIIVVPENTIFKEFKIED